MFEVLIMSRYFYFKSLMALVGVAAAMSVAAAPTGHVAAGQAFAALTTQHATALRQGDVISGSLADSQPIHIEVALKLRHLTQLHRFLATAKTSTPSMVQHKMSSAQFVARYAPTAMQAKKVAAYLQSAGFTQVTIAPNRLLIFAAGTPASIEQAFNTHLAQVKTKSGRMAFMNTSAVHIPASLQENVLSVIGLQNVYRPHTFIKPVPAGPHPLYVTAHYPTEFSSIYGGSGVPTAAGVPIGIITEGDLSQTIADLNAFTTQNDLPAVTTQTVNTGGTSSHTNGTPEWNLDSQDIVGMADGQVGSLIFYNMPWLYNTDLTADINTAVAANATKIINVSLGECETDAQDDGSAAAADQAFQQAVAQGQTFSVSSGDAGADECGDGGTTPSWPASSPYVVAVGGTTLDTSYNPTPNPTYYSESVWSGGGGSISTFEPKPGWQSSVLSGNYRGVPDIAFDADPESGAKIIVNGAAAQYGGTSLSAPLFVGAWARLLAAHPALGFAAPCLYQIPAADYHDVTSGNNGYYYAQPGWDLATGFGSFKLASVNADIGSCNGGSNVPPVADFSDTANGLIVSFTDGSTDSDGVIIAHSWGFGDGSTSTDTNPNHTYANPGTYGVSLTVTDNGAASDTTAQSVTVSDTGNVLQNGVPITGISGSQGDWGYYALHVPAGASDLNFTIDPGASGTGDADLYVKFGSQPSGSNYGWRSTNGSGTPDSCSPSNIQAGTYYVGVYGWATYAGWSVTGSYNTSGGG